MTDEREVSQEDVWNEHLQDVDGARQSLYMVVVLIGGIVLMLPFMALLEAMQ